MFEVLDDIEQRAEGLHLLERDAEVADLAVTEYSSVTLGARLHASLGLELRLRLVGGPQVSGRLARTGADWLLLVEGPVEWIVRHAGIASVAGASVRADSEETWSVFDRLTLRAVLRRLAEANEDCVVRFLDDRRVEGRVVRVGRDFFELRVGEGRDRLVQLVPVSSVAALQGRAR